MYSEDAVKAAFLYRFAAFVDWPETPDAGSSFVIAVVGADGVTAQLRRLEPKLLIQNRPVEIRALKPGPELSHVQVLYIGPDHRGRAAAVLAAAQSRPILVVTDTRRGLDDGGVINFVKIGRSIRFEISLTAAVCASARGSFPWLLASRVRLGRAAETDHMMGIAMACTRRSKLLAPFALLAIGTNAEARGSASSDELMRMSLEELSNVEVTSVSKSARALGAAPAAIYVIGRDDIARSGATSIAEALRLAPNLRITQLGASNHVASARGFGGAPDLQNFANKMLVLIDGRSVYTPLFSGVYFDAQDVILGDVERIEVVSGPGATLWGANAMNGVINIITRRAADTTGTLLHLGAGDREQRVSARYGAPVGEQGAFRVYAKAFERGSMELTDDSSARDRWSSAQGGFRYDWASDRDALTFQGDLYDAQEDQLDAGDVSLSGANALLRWQRSFDRSQLQIQTYYDRTERAAPSDGVAFELNTYDLELQHSFMGPVHEIVWGAGVRVHDYDIRNSAALMFVPPKRTLTLGNLFAQDTIAVGDAFRITLGLKLENDPYASWTPLPEVRVSWAPSSGTFFWASGSRAIRSPTPFDVDVVENIGSTVFLTGNADFETEKVTAYEVGYRGQPSSILSLSASVFYNEYDDLRTIEPAPGTFLPLRWDNLMEGHTRGVEAWATIQVASGWRLSPGVRYLDKNLSFKPSASGLIGVAQAGNDPEWQASLRSSIDLGRDLTFDAFLRYVDELPDPLTDDYTELGARFGWRVSQSLEIGLSGFNLLDSRHREYAAPNGVEIRRSVFFDVRLAF